MHSMSTGVRSRVSMRRVLQRGRGRAPGGPGTERIARSPGAVGDGAARGCVGWAAVTAPAEFARDYAAGADPDDVAAIGADDVDGAARAHWDLAEHRDGHEVVVWIGNPSRGRDGWDSPHTVVLVVSDDA